MQYLRIEGTLPGLNEIIKANRTHLHVGARQKADTEKHIMLAIRAAQLRPVRNPVHMNYTWVESSKRRDKDNIACARKFIQDALVRAGILQGDGWAHVVGFSDNFAVRKTAPGVMVEIVEVENERTKTAPA